MEAYVEVLPDFQNFRNQATSQMSSILGGAGAAGGLAAGSAMNGGILGAVPKLAGPLIAAFAALGIGKVIGETIGAGIRFGLAGIDLASDLAETQSAVKEIFGSAASGIEAFASTANITLGQTRQQALDASKTFGALGQAAGLTGSDLVDFSTGLVGLATDLASFNNTDVDTALNALRAGLSGESEPLRQFQVFLNDATLKQKALELGIYDGTGALTDQQRILAAQGAIFDKTSNQQGDFARTSGGLAAQQKILASSFEEAQTKLGTALMPTMLLFTQLANDTLIPLLDDVIEQVGPLLTDALTDSAPAFIELVEAVVPLIPPLVQLSVEVIPPLLAFLGFLAEQISGVMTAVSLLSRLLSGDVSLAEFGEKAHGLSGWLGWLTDAVFNTAAGIRSFATDVVTNMRKFANGVATNISTAVAFIASLPGWALAAVGDLGGVLWGAGRSLIGGFINGIWSMFGAVGGAVGGLMRYVRGFFPHSPAKHGPFSGAGWTAIADSGRAIADQLSSGFESRPQILSGVKLAIPLSDSGRGVIASEASRGGFVNYGTIQVTDERALIEEVSRQQRRANFAAGVGRVNVS